MTTAAIFAAWGLAMLVAMGVNAWGWRSWMTTFSDASDPIERGSVDLDAGPDESSRRIARLLASSSGPVIGRILEADRHIVRAELRPSVSSRKGGGYSTATALLVCHIDERMDGCRVEYSLDPRTLGQGLKTATAVMLCLGATAIAAAAVLFPLFVIPSDTPAIKAQTAQVLQLVHFLWPPFLLSYQARRARNVVTQRTIELMSNLPYT